MRHHFLADGAVDVILRRKVIVFGEGPERVVEGECVVLERCWIGDPRGLALHLDDVCRSSVDLPLVERPHAHSHLHRRHAELLRSVWWAGGSYAQVQLERCGLFMAPALKNSAGWKFSSCFHSSSTALHEKTTNTHASSC